MWSNEMLVMIETTGRTTFVESSRPPTPTSSTTARPAAGEVQQPHRGRDLEKRRAAVP